MKRVIIFLSLLCLMYASEGLCDVRCLDSEGEAAIINNDVPSARTEAIARAKWQAVEQAAGVEVKAQTIVQNMAFVDEAVSKQIHGVVTGYKVLGEDKGKDSVRVKINACVEVAKARDAASSLALNNSIAVFIPARKPKVIGEKRERHAIMTKDEYDETNLLSESLIGRLAEQGYTVADIAPTNAIEAQDIENAMKSGNFLSLRSLVYKFLTNILLIGKIDYTISTSKGQDVGYGISMPFNNVTVRLTYRIITRDASGRVVVLAAGTGEEKSMANSVEDATAEGLKKLSESAAPVIIDKIGQYIKGISKKIQVRVDGVSDLPTNFTVKDTIQNIAWVTDIQEKGLGEFTVSYPENIVYLANSISQKPGFRVENFSQSSVSANYRK